MFQASHTAPIWRLIHLQVIWVVNCGVRNSFARDVKNDFNSLFNTILCTFSCTIIVWLCLWTQILNSTNLYISYDFPGLESGPLPPNWTSCGVENRQNQHKPIGSRQLNVCRLAPWAPLLNQARKFCCLVTWATRASTLAGSEAQER